MKNTQSNIIPLLLIITIATNLVLSTAASPAASPAVSPAASPAGTPALSPAVSPAVSPAAVRSGEKVLFNIYYEALCPYCENSIVNYLYKIFEKGLISIVDLKISPYGNARIASNGTIICQHGEWECILNTVEACAIHTWPAAGDYFPFVYCVEKLSYEGKYTEWETCFEKLNLDSKPVKNCSSSGFGHELNLQYADEIKALQPPHTYVPWVTVNGQPIDYRYFISSICKAYKGSNVPQACLESSNPMTTPKNTANHPNNVCYKEDNTN